MNADQSCYGNVHGKGKRIPGKGQFSLWNRREASWVRKREVRYWKRSVWRHTVQDEPYCLDSLSACDRINYIGHVHDVHD